MWHSEVRGGDLLGEESEAAGALKEEGSREQRERGESTCSVSEVRSACTLPLHRIPFAAS